MTTEHFIAEALQLPVTAIGYQVSRRLRTLYPDKMLLEGGDQSFNMEEYAHAGHCNLIERAVPISQRVTYWRGSGSQLLHRAHQTWFAVAWQGEQLDVLIMHFGDGMSSPYHYYILADHADVAERFLCAVCDWNMELRDEVLVFEGGGWHKDADLFAAIKGATLCGCGARGGWCRVCHLADPGVDPHQAR